MHTLIQDRNPQKKVQSLLFSRTHTHKCYDNRQKKLVSYMPRVSRGKSLLWMGGGSRNAAEQNQEMKEKKRREKSEEEKRWTCWLWDCCVITTFSLLPALLMASDNAIFKRANFRTFKMEYSIMTWIMWNKGERREMNRSTSGKFQMEYGAAASALLFLLKLWKIERLPKSGKDKKMCHWSWCSPEKWKTIKNDIHLSAMAVAVFSFSKQMGTPQHLNEMLKWNIFAYQLRSKHNMNGLAKCEKEALTRGVCEIESES